MESFDKQFCDEIATDIIGIFGEDYEYFREAEADEIADDLHNFATGTNPPETDDLQEWAVWRADDNFSSISADERCQVREVIRDRLAAKRFESFANRWKSFHLLT